MLFALGFAMSVALAFIDPAWAIPLNTALLGWIARGQREARQTAQTHADEARDRET